MLPQSYRIFFPKKFTPHPLTLFRTNLFFPKSWVFFRPKFSNFWLFSSEKFKVTQNQRQEVEPSSFNQQKLVSSSTGTASTSTQTDGAKSESASEDMHECTHCSIFFKDYVMYTVHMGCHAGDSPFKCNVCQVDCGDAIQFACHFARGHSK